MEFIGCKWRTSNGLEKERVSIWFYYVAMQFSTDVQVGKRWGIQVQTSANAKVSTSEERKRSEIIVWVSSIQFCKSTTISIISPCIPIIFLLFMLSYTDRILWKSADGLADNVEPILYEPCPGFITSDHKPIRGGYLVKTISGWVWSSFLVISMASAHSRASYLTVTLMHCIWPSLVTRWINHHQCLLRITQRLKGIMTGRSIYSSLTLNAPAYPSWIPFHLVDCVTHT